MSLQRLLVALDRGMEVRRPGPRACLLGAAAAVALPALALLACARPAPLALPSAPAGAPTTPGPAPRARAFDAAAWNARCEGCHAEIAAEWRASLHHRAYTDPMFQRQLAREPFAFCRGCHAPEASPSGDGPEGLRTLGVGCVTCHVVGDQILAVRKGDGAARDGEHHPLTRSATLEAPAACGACHQFAFPGEPARQEPLLMQSTMDEHARGPHGNQPCASCHLPLVPGGATGQHRSHAFSASRDEALVRAAVLVEEGPFTDNTLTLRLRPGAVGHAFPTGDMLRRLLLVIDVLDAEGRSVEHAERALGRHFGFTHTPNRAPRRVVARDDRVGAGADPVVLRHAARRSPPGGHLRYALRYERVEDPGDAEHPPVVEGSILLAAGTFALTAPAR
jgi:hypothetical protein